MQPITNSFLHDDIIHHAHDVTQNNQPVLCSLTQFGFLKISGPDAHQLLQGQLTCDITTLQSTFFSPAQLGAHCNPQGRIISSFYIFMREENYYLLLPTDMLDIAKNALQKYAIFYKVFLTIDHELHAICINHFIDIKNVFTDSVLIKNQLTMMQFPYEQSRFLFIGKESNIKNVITTLASSFNYVSSRYWNYCNIVSGIPTVYAQSTGLFLPHELNLHDLDAINFNKGCYTGQEIIARMHYRGKLKNHLYYAIMQHDIAPTPGTDIYCDDNGAHKKCGIIVDSYTFEQKHTECLIVTDEHHANNNHLFLQSNEKMFFTTRPIKYNNSMSYE